MSSDDRSHSHNRQEGWLAGLKARLAPHHHDPAERMDSVLETSAQGIRAVKISLLGLLATAIPQLVVVVLSGSVALLSDTLHNFGDALTALPLWIAFGVGRRRPNSRYTYGYGRLEDLAGIFVVVAISVSAAIAGYESIDRFFNPQSVEALGLVVIASIIGFVGNEIVAIYRIRVGRSIGSAALVADGLHARTDGLTSLAVLAGAVGVSLGWEQADPLVGVLISVAILFILKNAARDIYRRLMDAVDPGLVTQVQGVLANVPGVEVVDQVRIRWIGHELRADVQISVRASLDVAQGHEIAVRAHHALLHEVARLTSALIHVHPFPLEWNASHAEIAHHVRTDESSRR